MGRLNDNLKKAKVQLVLSQPFFASLMLRLEQHEDKTCQTAYTDGHRIGYNPEFFDKIGTEGIKTVLAHEVMHVAMLHHTRRAGRDPQKWNQAADYAINGILQDAGFEIPAGGLINSAYTGKSAEEIYNLLPSSPEGGKGKNGQGGGQLNGNDPGGMGEVRDAPAGTEAQKKEIEAKVKQAVAQAAMAAKKAGNLPADLDRLVSEILEPQIPWREVLARFLSEISRNDYTWKKPNRRYMSAGLYLPALENEEPGKVALLVDTSGSISNTELNTFASEMQAILDTFQTKCEVIYVDTKVAGTQVIEPGEEVKLHPKGGGGTDFRPGFEHIEQQEEQPKAAVYFTDGCCNSFPQNTEFPVLWAQYGSEFKPPFGEVLKIKTF